MRTVMYYFFETNGYVFEILLSIFLITWWIERKKGFIWRLILTAAILVAVSEITSDLPCMSAVNDTLRTITIFALCVCGLKFCLKASTWQALFYGTAGCAAQHFSYKAATTVLAPVWYFAPPKADLSIFLGFAYPMLFIFFILLCHLFFGKRLKGEDISHLKSSPLILFLLIGMQLATNIFHNMFSYFDTGAAPYTVFNLFDILCCLFLLALQCEIAKSENEQRNNEIMKQILYQQKQQMKLSKENIELINIKCHDIKNQIAMLGSRVPKDEIRELESAVNIYDTEFKTGNEALDVLLMEKFMLCENKNIRLDCMIQGESLSFMKQSDIYSLFGNAVDNAIEALSQLSDADRRCISVKGREDRGMFVVHIENFYEGSLSFDNGLPKTTKKDKRYHGFGMKSIRMITEKYHGYFKVKAENGLFILNILIQLPSK